MLLVKTARLESYYPVPGQAGDSIISRLYCGVIRFADSGHGKEKIINNSQLLTMPLRGSGQISYD
jgi:hypothetical protein